MRIAVFGAGSIGTIVGAYLAAGGQDVDLITRNRAHVDAMNRHGARVTGKTEFVVPVRAVTPDAMSGTYDLVLLLTKQLENRTVLPNLMAFLGPDSIVCSLQNGVPEETVAEIVGRDRVIGGTIEFGATWTEPGVSCLTSELEQMKRHAFQIGELDGEISDRVKRVQAVLELVGGTHISDNMVGSKWSKLWLNSTFSGLSAALNGTFGDVVDSDVGVRSAIEIADETIRVGHACGVRFAKLFGLDIDSLALQPGEDIDRRIHLFRAMMGPGRLVKASMLQDLEKKRKTEIDDINGVVQRRGMGAGVATRYNDLVIQLVKQAESQQTVPDFRTNVKLFEELATRLEAR